MARPATRTRKHRSSNTDAPEIFSAKDIEEEIKGRSTKLSDTAYPRLKAAPSRTELKNDFTPSQADLAFAAAECTDRRDPLARVMALIHLAVYEQLGFFLKAPDIPEAYVRHIALASGYVGTIGRRAIKRYSGSKAELKHKRAIRAYRETRELDTDGWRWLRAVAETTATEKHFTIDIINVVLEELVRHRYELPSFGALDRLVRQMREVVHQRYFDQINASLNDALRQMIQGLLLTPESNPYSGWHVLKREPRKPTGPEIRSFLEHVDRTKKLAEQLPPVHLPPRKLQYFKAWARSRNAAEMAEYKPVKRYALATVFVRTQYARVLDDVVDIFLRLMSKIQNNAELARIEYQREHADRADTLIKQLKDLLVAFDLAKSDSKRVQAVRQSLIDEIENLIKLCNEHLTHAGTNYQPWVLDPYAPARPHLMNCLEAMNLKSSSSDSTTERMLAIVLAQRHTRPRGPVEPSVLGLNAATDLNWLDEKWREHVEVKVEGRKGVLVHRTYFELAVLTQIAQELKCGDLYIPNGDKYDDYREQLVDDETLDRELATLGDFAGFPTEAKAFCDKLKKELTEKAAAVDAGLPNNPDARMVDGVLKLTRADSPKPNEELERLDQAIRDALPQVGIMDVLIDTCRWLRLPRFFKPISGSESRIDDLEMRVVATLVCYGLNFGVVQTTRSIRGLSRQQVAWLNLKSVTEDRLQDAIDNVANKFNEFELPTYWGSGKSVSADGTKWSLYEQNLVSTKHIRYGGYGGLAYYLVSDTYICLISFFNPCGIHEGAHILDLMMAKSDIQPDTIHGDTHAQSYPIFGLSYLLGFQLMPRIASVRTLRLARPTEKTRYQHLQSMFKDVVNWELIAKHFRDLMRLVISIKTGKITPSTILRRFGSESKGNRLSRALHELGKVIRTLFLLKYIESLELRKTIHSATNKSEAYNEFAKKLAVGHGGVITENERHEQVKVIRYNHLVASLVILFNTEHMSRVLATLREEGVDIREDLLKLLSPYRREHINLHGEYPIDIARATAPLDPQRPILGGRRNLAASTERSEETKQPEGPKLGEDKPTE